MTKEMPSTRSSELEFEDRPAQDEGSRFGHLVRIGGGGMGDVYRGYDPQAGRAVAIKYLRFLDPESRMRFQREAHAQSKIRHPNVCAVYEVCLTAPRPHLVLQFIDGKPLHEVAAQMTLDEKLAVMRDVAIAIHEANKSGIVHRDITPSNVIVECSEDGRWIPIVTDFGLARVATAENDLTATGQPLGTPQYMAPEQVRSDLSEIDRRTDVWGLGATFYRMVTGSSPFTGANRDEIRANVLHEDPRPPRSLEPGLPADLEIITLKCLAKDPQQRYESALAFAADLDRYIHHEPILARREPRWQRVRRIVRRHRALVALGTASLAAVLVVSALWLWTWSKEHARVTEQAILARDLGQQAAFIEWFLRSVAELPLRDTRPARELIRAQLRAIAATRHDLGPRGDALVHDARGRGHLALHEWQRAADELERAVAPDGGLSNLAELHLRRGRALGELYRGALEDARRSGDPGWLARRRQELEQQYLVPARAELAASRGAGPDASLLEALIAQYRGDFEDAERRAVTVAETAPWPVEAKKLAADAAYGAAMVAFDRGDYETARRGLARAEARYAEASDSARSDASTYEAWAQARLQQAQLDDRQGHHGELIDAVRRALDTINAALRADPEVASAHTLRSYVLLLGYRTQSLPDILDGRPLVDGLVDAAARAVDLDRRDPVAWDALGNAHLYFGIAHANEPAGADAWRRAFEDFDHALALRPNYPWALNDLGVAHRWRGTTIEQAGGDPRPAYRDALASYARAETIDPGFLYACTNQVEGHVLIAEYEALRSIYPDAAITAAMHAGARCRGIDPSYAKVSVIMARAQIAAAAYLVENADNPRGPLDSARDLLLRATEGPGETRESLGQRLIAARLTAQFFARGTDDPAISLTSARSAIAGGRAAFEQRKGMEPRSAFAYAELARICVAEAKLTARAGGNPDPPLREAEAAAQQAVEVESTSVDARLAAAEVSLQIAARKRSRNMVETGLRYVQPIHAAMPSMSQAQAIERALLQLRDQLP